jgi:hypothetical protein
MDCPKSGQGTSFAIFDRAAEVPAGIHEQNPGVQRKLVVEGELEFHKDDDQGM